ncbi:hypothetical protein D3C74_315020 [compost metagenome]
MSTYTFKYGCKGQLASFSVNAGLHRSAADEDGWNVDTQSAHHHPRRDFITVRNADHTVKPVRGNDCFKCVRNNLTAWQGVPHADMTHSNTVIYTDGVKLERYTASFTDRFFNDLAEFLQMHVTRYNINIGITYCDKRFIEVLFLNTCGTQQTAVRRTVEAFFNHVRAHFLGCHDDDPPR